MSKLVFINRFFYPDISATSQMLSDLAFELAASGLDVHVVTSRLLYDDNFARLPNEESIEGVHIHRIWTTSLGRLRNRHQIVDYVSFFAFGLWRLFRLARRGDTVIVKTDPPLLSVPTMLLSRLCGWRQINWLQDAFPEIAQAAGVSTKHRLLDKAFFGLLTGMRNLSLQHTARTVILGERMQEHLSDEGIDAERLAVIPNWANTQTVFPVAYGANPLRRQWIAQGQFVVGYSGNMGIAHDFDVLLSAAALLSVDPQILFLLIGNGKRKIYVERDIAQRNLSNVLLKPYQPREALANSLSVPDVHIVTLRPKMEGLIVPSKFYGVAAAGRPTIFLGDADGEVARMVARYDCGVTVDPADPAALAAAIKRYQQDPAMLSRHGKNARQMAVEHFDLKASVAKWRALITDGQTPS